MKKITLSDLRAIQPYSFIDEGEDWIIMKFPNHHWTGYKAPHPELKHLLKDTFLNRAYTIPKDQIKNYIDCDEEVLERYKVLG